jgi:hypothetical protein
MSVEIFADVLSEGELSEITHSELYFTAEQMIERGAISYSQFLERGSVEAREVSLVIYDEVVYMRSAVDGMLYPVTEFTIDEETPLSEVSVKYGLVEFEEDYDEDDDSLDSFGDGYTDADFEVDEESDAELLDDYDQFEKTMTEQYGNKADV